MPIDELQEYGLVEMNDDEIERFLSTQKVGVLGLVGDAGTSPYLLPLSFGYDGERALYFTYLFGSESRKQTLSEAVDTASFLVFTVDTKYTWESVLVSGSLTAVPETEWDKLESVLSNTWRPDLIETASVSAEISVYELQIDDQRGVKHQGLPPSLQRKVDQ